MLLSDRYCALVRTVRTEQALANAVGSLSGPEAYEELVEVKRALQAGHFVGIGRRSSTVWERAWKMFVQPRPCGAGAALGSRSHAGRSQHVKPDRGCCDVGHADGEEQNGDLPIAESSSAVYSNTMARAALRLLAWLRRIRCPPPPDTRLGWLRSASASKQGNPRSASLESFAVLITVRAQPAHHRLWLELKSFSMISRSARSALALFLYVP